MKRLLFLLLGTAVSVSATGQTKGLLISEFLTNPNGNDSPYEYVELVATTTINFSSTPYTIVFTDNGTATSNGWKAGNSISYAFQISSGTVTAGQVVYVGGSSMAPLANGGLAVRTKNTGSSSGDNFGSSNSGGVLGQGGSNCDGIAVFNVSASSISSSTVPVDAIFFGSNVGSAYKTSSSGYQMPVNDLYSGGKLGNSIFLAPDPSADQLVKATSGAFNAATNTFTSARSWAITTSATYNATSITLGGSTNSLPSITLATPAVSGNAPATVTLSATASDSDGTVSSVQFYNGITLLGTDNTSPYSYSWTNVATGTYSITAKATDNSGGVTTTSAASVTVNAAGNTAPVISLAVPTVSGNAPATVTLSATASDSDGTVSSVQFYNGSTLLGTDNTSPYSYSWTNVATGTYSITAKATDNSGGVTTTSAASVTVNAAGNTAPVISLAVPTVSGNAPATVTLSATASDSDGTVSSVQFYNGSTLLGTDNTSPYSYSWTNVATGTYSITAKATDNAGTVTTSNTRIVTVNAGPNTAPSLSFNTTASKYVNLSSGKVSCVMNNATDPVRITGLDINISDENLSTVAFTMTSSNTSVVPASAFTVTGTGNARKFTINPSGVGYSTITLRATDSQGLNSSVITISLAVSNALATAAVQDIYNTGVADGSTGIAVDEDYMFVADDETNVIKLFNRNNSGLSVYQFDVTPYLNLSGTEVDMEASFRSPTNPNRIYWIGSLSNSKTGDARPDRNRIFATDIVGTGANATLVFVGYYNNLRSKLITWGNNNGYNFTAKAATGIEPKRIDGFNIEGMEMGPDGTTLYIGFRAPYVGSGTNKALICPLNNFEAWFNNGAPAGNPVFGAPIELNLNNHGIRSLAKNAANEYLIVAGSYAATGTFELYKWNGLATSAPVELLADLTNLKPEGIVEVPAAVSGTFQVDLISDLGSNILYNDGLENKEVIQANHRKFLTSTLDVSVAGARDMAVNSTDEGILESISYYPNPATDDLTIEFSHVIDAGSEFTVYTVTGALIRTEKLPADNTFIKLDLSGLAPGNYFIRSNRFSQTLKVIKQ